MNKVESLRKLKEWGFNVPPCKFINPGRYFTELPTLEFEHFGIRTAVEGKGFSLPFIRNCPKESVPDHVNRLAREGYTVIISPWYPAEWSMFGGHVQIKAENDIYLEYVQGANIVRDVMASKDLQKVRVRSVDALLGDLGQVVAESLDIFNFAEKPIIAEFSVMDRPVGVLEDYILFWEVRDA